MRSVVSISFLVALIIFSSAGHSQNIIDPTRRIDWSSAGAGPIPNRTTICATLSPGATAADINNAIANCPDGQVVFLNAGTYNLDTGVVFSNKNNVTLRGAGPDQTFLIFTGFTGCGGKFAAVCVINGYPIDNGGPFNVADWTANYAQGTSTITLNNLGGNGVKPVAGTMMTLDQLSDDPTDTGEVFVCNTQGVCAQSGSGGQQSRIQQQIVTVTSISAGAAPWTVGISPGVYMPNWRASKSPRAWWPGNQASNSLPVSGDGIEDLSIDSSNSGSSYGITFFWATNSWIKNIREIRVSPEPVGHYSRKAVLFFLSAHITVRDSYFFGRTGDDDYAINCYWCSDNLVENNIMQHWPLPIQNERGQGNVWAYNYMVNNLWGPPVNEWAQGSNSYHSPGSSYELNEGNDGHGLEMENYFGPVHFITGFRNRWTGVEGTQNAQTVPVFDYALNRYVNLIGNVLGTAGYHTQYQTLANGNTALCNKSIYAIGLGWNCASGGGATGMPLDDPLTVSTLFRWGNYDTVTGAVKWDQTEVPSGLSLYANAVPGQALPVSLYLPGKPNWFGSTPWPPIGPDVTGGDISNVGGHAYRIPARKCFEDVMGGTYGDTTARSFNANNCYGGTPSPPDTQAPSQVTGLIATAVSQSQIDLAWTVATDNIGVAGYRIYRGGVQVATSTSTTYSSTGLLASTTYSYTVQAYDAAGNNGAQSSSAGATTQAQDTINPTISITSPAGGTISGTTTITANAADNIAVAGVQFKIDGINTVTEDTATPYSISWDTTSAVNGTHSISAVARDAAGNIATSSAVTVTVSNAAATVPVNDLLAYWKFDETSGSTASDSAGAYAGAVNGAAWVSGKKSNALNFNGINSYATFSGQQVQGSFASWSLWIKPDKIDTTEQPIFNTWNFDPQDPTLRVTTGEPFCGAGNDIDVYTPGGQICTTSNVLNQSQWIHVVIMYNGSAPSNFARINVYVNGVEQTSEGYSGSIPANLNFIENNMYLGRSYNSYFNGSVDEFRIYNRLLSNVEVQQLYQEGSSPYSGIILRGRVMRSAGIACPLCIVNFTMNGVNGMAITATDGTFMTVLATTFAPGTYNSDIIITDGATVKNFKKRVIII